MRFHLKSCGRTVLFAAIACVGFAAAATAAPGDEAIDVTIDFAKVLRIDQAADTIIVGNPGIADASIDDEKTIILTGRTAGTTNLIVLDAAGKEIMNTTVRVSSDVRQLTTVFFGKARQTFSCAPTCEQVISVGDSAPIFDNANTQITTRRQFSATQ